VGLGLTRAEGGCRNYPRRNTVSPLVTVVVVAYRDCVEVEALVQNLKLFRCGDLEVIIIDGASDDGTIEFLELNSRYIDYWLSEPDTGIYDAMNKGIDASWGEYILHLNAGDRLIYPPLDVLRKCLEDGVDVASFRVLIDSKAVFRPKSGFPMRFDNWWHHQGTFYRRSSHLRYDPKYRICGDFEHNQRLIKAGASIKLLSEIVSEHKNNGISMHPSGREEVLQSIRSHFGVFYLAIAFVRLELNKVRGRIMRFVRG
jgi:glycosyltransferase involved in cell wall biosynthesis